MGAWTGLPSREAYGTLTRRRQIVCWRHFDPARPHVGHPTLGGSAHSDAECGHRGARLTPRADRPGLRGLGRGGPLATRRAERDDPVLTSASGWLAQLLAGAVFVEFVFGWKGLGFLLFDALEQQDLPVVMGGVLVVSFVFVCVNALTDVAYRWIDPRAAQA